MNFGYRLIPLYHCTNSKPMRYHKFRKKKNKEVLL